jgi:hypothetical protein
MDRPTAAHFGRDNRPAGRQRATAPKSSSPGNSNRCRASDEFPPHDLIAARRFPARSTRQKAPGNFLLGRSGRQEVSDVSGVGSRGSPPVPSLLIRHNKGSLAGSSYMDRLHGCASVRQASAVGVHSRRGDRSRCRILELGLVIPNFPFDRTNSLQYVR